MNEKVFKPGDLVVSRFHVVHAVKASNQDEHGFEWVTLRDGREFDASEFRPYVEEFHGTSLQHCSDCITILVGA